MKHFFTRLFFGFLLFIFGGVGLAFAQDLPFSDVPNNAWYRDALIHLYKEGVIEDTSDHLFRPNDLLRRDEFVAISLVANCSLCAKKTFDTLSRPNILPFVDVSEKNQYGYCVDEAKTKGYTQGYVLDVNKQHVCENGSQYFEVPFCPDNYTSRIEAATMLLRQVGLWDDEFSAPVVRTREIPDINDQWYPFARKALEFGLIVAKDNGTIDPHTAITRGEFAFMAEKILSMNTCHLLGDGNDFAAEIDAQEKTGNTYDFRAITDAPYPVCEWKFANTVTQKQERMSGCSIPDKLLEDGEWIVFLRVQDDVSKKEAHALTTLVIKTAPSALSVWLRANPNPVYTGQTVSLPSSVKSSPGEIVYEWEIEGKKFSGSKNETYIFQKTGAYPVTVYAKNTKTNDDGYAKVVVHVLDNPDIDGDGVIEDDICPLVAGSSDNKGCPIFDTPPRSLFEAPNACLTNATQNGAIIVRALCNSCPCEASVNFHSLFRKCDIIFPTITSPDTFRIFSKGDMYEVK